MGCPIRKSTDQRPFAPPRGLSQLVTSFIACESLGIHHTPFSTFYRSGVKSQKGRHRVAHTFSCKLAHQESLPSAELPFFAFASNMSKIACRPRCLGGCAEHQGNDPRTGLLPLSLPARVPDCDIYGFHKQRCSQGGVRESWSCLPLTVLDLSSGLSCRFLREGAVSCFQCRSLIYCYMPSS